MQCIHKKQTKKFIPSDKQTGEESMVFSKAWLISLSTLRQRDTVMNGAERARPGQPPRGAEDDGWPWRLLHSGWKPFALPGWVRAQLRPSFPSPSPA